MPYPFTTGFLVALAVLAWAADAGAQASGGPTTALSPELRAAFIAEMQHLDAGLQRAVSALARADWPALERIAVEIRGSLGAVKNTSGISRLEASSAGEPYACTKARRWESQPLCITSS